MGDLTLTMQDPLFSAFLLVATSTFSCGSYSQHNTSSARCFNEQEAYTIKLLLSEDFDAFEDDCSDGVCLDIDGTGYKLGQELDTCGGCMVLNCTFRPCVGRNGERCEMYWNLTSIDEQCCQNCEGRVLPPNQALPPVALHDSCGTTEQSVCKAGIM